MNANDVSLIIKGAKKIHFVGIGGISMSSLAVITEKMGYMVTGSDQRKSAITEKMENGGIKIAYGHSSDNVLGADAVVYTAAAHFDNPELKYCLENAIPIITRAEYLGWLMSSYNCRIGVSGTHGKSTVTSMLTEIYMASELDPTVVSGAELSSLGGAYRLGNKNYFIFEACEYCDSFLSFTPTVTVVTNLEYDHADYFKDMEQLRASFRKYVSYGKTAVLNGDDEEALALENGYEGKSVTFSLHGKGDYNAENVRYENGMASFDLVVRNQILSRITLSVPGKHNVYNAIAAAAAALENGCDVEAVKRGLKAFGGAKRRFEYVCKTEKGATVYNDYAHHPSEIKATLSAAKAFNKRVVCIFQPHTYSRTASLFEDFTKAFADADITIFADIYAARETDTLGVSSELLSEKTPNSLCLGDFDSIAKYINENCGENDLVLILGAGDIVNIGKLLA